MSQDLSPLSRKRPRTSHDDIEIEPTVALPVLPETPDEIQRHPDLWFDDGNVVLVATDNLGFRLHRSVLSRHSSIFQDMFGLPQPQLAETYEGCPVVHLQDSSEELSFLLTAFYDGRKNSYFNRELSVTFSAVTAMLRLGSKYQVDHIRDDAIYRLQLCFPSHLEHFDSSLHVKSEQPPISDITGKDAICVVNLARKFHLDALLPAALYTCCQLGNAYLVNGVSYPNDITEKLSPDDLLLCLDTRDTLLEENTTNTAFICSPVASPSCIHSNVCLRGLRSLIRVAQKEEIFARDDPLKDLSPFIRRHAPEVGVCEPCIESLVISSGKGRVRVWNTLGELFGVKGWPSLL